MQIQLNTDHNIEGEARLASLVQGVIEDSLSRFENQVTRVEVHLKDANSRKGGAVDKQCTMEARLAGLKPVAVNHQAPNLSEAYEGAARKLERSLGSILGRLRRHH